MGEAEKNPRARRRTTEAKAVGPHVARKPAEVEPFGSAHPRQGGSPDGPRGP